ncbi:M28 family peptidase [Heliobacterium mobile]|uniref:M28 family peptidase n=1 Tax=Heliobacterium mobile TaxID=28064 RepID=UPI0014782B3E|nr:M28 family peptidase [Heliobacterium mobile]
MSLELKQLYNEILEKCKSRNTKKGKKQFEKFVKEKLKEINLDIETDSIFIATNIITKTVEPKIILMAHYDTIKYPDIFEWIFKIIGPIGSKQILKLFIFICFILTCLYFSDKFHIYKYIFFFKPVVFSNELLNSIYFFCSNFFFEYPLSCLTFFVLSLDYIAKLITYRNKLHNANDNTSGIISILSIMLRIARNNPSILNKIQICFTDLEELGRIGSWSFNKKIPKDKEVIIINLDGVGIGDYLLIDGNNESNKKGFTEEIISYFEQKEYEIVKCRIVSDYRSIKENIAINISCGKKAKLTGYYIPNCHSFHDDEIYFEKLETLILNIIDYIEEKTS